MTSKEIRTQVNKILSDMQALALKGFDADTRAKFDRMNANVTALEADAERLEAMESRSTASTRFERSARPLSADGGLVADNPEARKKQFNQAFRSYARNGHGGLNAEERALLTTSDATGGAFVPQMFDNVLHEALKFYGPIAQKLKQKVTDKNGAPIKVALQNDTSNGLTLLATEGTSSPAETDPTQSSALLGVDTVTGGLVKVSFQELSDSDFDLDNLIRDLFGRRYGRGIETAVTTGLDSSGTALPNQTTGGLIGAATAGTTTATLAGGIGWDDLTATYTALDPAYVANATWVMNSNTRGYLVGLKDGFGRPYFTPDPSEDAPFSRILGYEIVLNQAMPNMGASAKPILFGDLSNAYMLRTDGQPSILRLNERYADTLEVGFLLFSRVGGLSLNAGVSPLVKLTQASS